MTIFEINTSTMKKVNGPIKKTTANPKKAIREMRAGVPGRIVGNKRETHKMSYIGDISKKKGEFGVFPTIAPKLGKSKSTSPLDWVGQGPKEAEAKGEMIWVKSRRKAEKLAAGSWKKGIEKKEAMREYRASKKRN